MLAKCVIVQKQTLILINSGFDD